MTDDTILLRPFADTDIVWLTRRHAEHYAASDGFDDSFGQLVDTILTEFAQDHDPVCERGWIAARGATPLGSIFCVRQDADTAKLRLFFLEPQARGQGLGQHLLETCTDFARAAHYTKLTLWTHESHRAAGALYDRHGFAKVASEPKRSFGVDVVQQHRELTL